MRRSLSSCRAGIGLARIGLTGISLAVAGAAILATLPAGNADAKDFYTRKRVNGQWVTGRFSKDDVTQATRPAAAQPGPTATRIPLPPVSPHSATAMGAEPEVFAASETATADAGDDRLARLRDALKARASELAVATAGGGPAFSSAALPAPAPAPAKFAPSLQALVPSSPVPSPPVTPPSAMALPAEAPARPIVANAAPEPAGMGSARFVSPPAATRAALEPRSISYDFETGVKTTVFESSVVREPFDVASVRAATGPASR